MNSTPDAFRGRTATSDTDEDAGWHIDGERFEPFSQVHDVFSRSRWDERIRDDRVDTFRNPRDSSE